MMDIVEERGMEIDLHRLPEMLECRLFRYRRERRLDWISLCIRYPIIRIKVHNLEHHHANLSIKESVISISINEYPVVYSDEIEDKIDEVSELLHSKYGNVNNLRWQ